MEAPKNINTSYIRAKEKLRHVKVFYVHLVGYLIVVTLCLYNLYIIEEGEYKDFIVWLLLTTIVSWTIFILIHAWSVYRWRVFFRKSWEERKVQEFLEEEKEENETTIWE